MAITHLELDRVLGPKDQSTLPGRRKLDDVSTSIAKAKRVVVVSGAGISCSSGIPDFRSADGLYSLVKKRYPDSFVTGKDLFSSGLFSNPSTTSIFLTFIAELSLACQAAHPTKTHHFIQRLDKAGKLLRSYTQNVDGFERRMGMESGGRGKGLHKKTTRNVELHGDLGRVRCTLCMHDYHASEEWVAMFREGEAPDCPVCEERCSARVRRSARAIPIGSLRPSIVLYDEPHPLGDEIGTLQAHDVGRNPDVLIIMGTSLKVSGLKSLVKDFAKAVHGAKKPGLVVFVNATKPSKEWEAFIDVHIEGQSDVWVEKVEETWRKIRPGDWETQTTLDMAAVAAASEGSGAKKGLPVQKDTAEKKQSSRETIFRNGLPTPRPSASPPLSPRKAAKIEAAAPPSPLSPSKRRNLPTPEPTPSPSKKSRPTAPLTSITATPGKGNLFSPSSTPARLQQQHASRAKPIEEEWADDEDVQNDVFGSPVRGATSAPSKGHGKSIVTCGLPSPRPRSRVGRDKENINSHLANAIKKAPVPGSPLKASVAGQRSLRTRNERTVMGVKKTVRG